MVFFFCGLLFFCGRDSRHASPLLGLFSRVRWHRLEGVSSCSFQRVWSLNLLWDWASISVVGNLGGQKHKTCHVCMRDGLYFLCLCACLTGIARWLLTGGLAAFSVFYVWGMHILCFRWLVAGDSILGICDVWQKRGRSEQQSTRGYVTRNEHRACENSSESKKIRNEVMASRYYKICVHPFLWFCKTSRVKIAPRSCECTCFAMPSGAVSQWSFWASSTGHRSVDRSIVYFRFSNCDISQHLRYMFLNSSQRVGHIHTHTCNIYHGHTLASRCFPRYLLPPRL